MTKSKNYITKVVFDLWISLCFFFFFNAHDFCSELVNALKQLYLAVLKQHLLFGPEQLNCCLVPELETAQYIDTLLKTALLLLL